MKDHFACPVCGSDKWESIERYLYLREDLATTKYTKFSALFRKLSIVGRALVHARPRRTLIHNNVLSPYNRLRREVLFHVWFKEQDEVQLESVFCSKCGFGCYKPRPEDEDIARKYEYLRRYESDPGGQTGHGEYSRKLDGKRARRIYDKCQAYLSSQQADILDYGGGNGKLMRPFKENRHRCYLIDYNDNPLPGILKLGSDIDDYRGQTKFDVIVCSHVLEHVSGVSKLVNRLRDLLKPDGIIYAEVPQEIWSGLKMDLDPVTHINFFTENSFSNLFLANGFEILEKKQGISNYGDSYLEVVWLVAKPALTSNPSLLQADTKRMLYPSRLSSIIKSFRLLIEPSLRKILGM